MPYLLNEKRFHKNSNGFEFHVHGLRTGEILVKMGQDFFVPFWKGCFTDVFLNFEPKIDFPFPADVSFDKNLFTT